MDILNFLRSIVDPFQTQTLAYLLLANFAGGVLASILDGTFEVVRLKDIGVRLLTMFGLYLAASVAARGLTDLDWLALTVFGALSAYLVTQIITNVRDILTKLGVPVPDWLLKYFERPKPGG